MYKNTINDEELLKRLNKHPLIRERIASILDVVDDVAGDLKRADDAEDRVVDEVRRMGQEALQVWAQTQVELTEADVRRSGRAYRDGKKNFAGTPPLATSASASPNTAASPSASARSRKARV
jgi:hypothetical protein